MLSQGFVALLLFSYTAVMLPLPVMANGSRGLSLVKEVNL